MHPRLELGWIGTGTLPRLDLPRRAEPLTKSQRRERRKRRDALARFTAFAVFWTSMAVTLGSLALTA